MRQLLSLATQDTIREVRVVFALLLASVLAFAGNPWAGIRPQTPPAENVAALLEDFRHVEVASVSDALEQLTGRKMYMSHRMRPLFPAKFAGFTVTVLLKRETNDDSNALDGMLAAIDQGAKDPVYVTVVEDG